MKAFHIVMFIFDLILLILRTAWEELLGIRTLPYSELILSNSILNILDENFVTSHVNNLC